jgi:hypothetical protein
MSVNQNLCIVHEYYSFIVYLFIHLYISVMSNFAQAYERAICTQSCRRARAL